jgi:hypothetical protein
LKRTLRPALVAAIAAFAVLGAPVAAHADDAAIKASIPPAFDALSKKEAAANKAIASFNKHRARVAARSRKKVRAVRRAVRTFAALLSAQQPSTPAGAAAKRALIRALNIEARATSQIDLAMKASSHSTRRRTNHLIRKANRTLRRASTASRRALKMVEAL